MGRKPALNSKISAGQTGNNYPIFLLFNPTNACVQSLTSRPESSQTERHHSRTSATATLVDRLNPKEKLPDDSCKEDIKKDGIRETGQ